MERALKIIRGINSVLLLLVLLALLGFAVWYAWYLKQWYADYAGDDASEETEEVDDDALELRLGDADTVTGTTTQMLSLTAAIYGRGRQTQIRNVLFLTPDGPAEGRWLFPAHRNLILESDQIRPWDSDDSLAPTIALYFEFVPDDPTDKFSPTEFDLRSVALSNPDGRGFVEVLHEVDEVLSYEQVEAGVLSILYSDMESVRRARVALKGFTILSDQLVAEIPDSL